jgi:hypothetical protein
MRRGQQRGPRIMSTFGPASVQFKRWLHCVFPRKRHQMRHLCDFACFLAKQVLSQLSYTPTRCNQSTLNSYSEYLEWSNFEFRFTTGRDTHDCVSRGSCAACGRRRLLEAGRNQNHARSRDGARRDGGFLTGSTGGIGLFPAYAHSFPTESATSRPPKGRRTDCQARRLQRVERVSHPEAFVFEIGRGGSSCLEESV